MSDNLDQNSVLSYANRARDNLLVIEAYYNRVNSPAELKLEIRGPDTFHTA
jgi:hypothetical protein